MQQTKHIRLSDPMAERIVMRAVHRRGWRVSFQRQSIGIDRCPRGFDDVLARR